MMLYVLRIFILIPLIKLSRSYESKLLYPTIYSITSFFISLFFIESIFFIIIRSLIVFLASYFFFWLLKKNEDNTFLWLLISVIGCFILII